MSRAAATIPSPRLDRGTRRCHGLTTTRVASASPSSPRRDERQLCPLRDLLQNRKQIAHRGLLVVNEDQRVSSAASALRIGDEVQEVARSGYIHRPSPRRLRPGLFDTPSPPRPSHRLGDQIADFLVVVQPRWPTARFPCPVGTLIFFSSRRRQRQLPRRCRARSHQVDACRDVLGAFAENRLRQGGLRWWCRHRRGRWSS